MKRCIAIACAALAVTALADVVIGTDPLDNMPLIMSDLQYQVMTNRAKASDDWGDGKGDFNGMMPADNYADAKNYFVADGAKASDNTFWVGIDKHGLDRYVSNTTARIEMLENEIARLRDFCEMYEQGRVRVHGKLVRQEVLPDGRMMRRYYEDGWVHCVRATARTNEMPRVEGPRSELARQPKRTPKPKAERKVDTTRISDRHRRALEEMRDAAKRKPREVTIVHDAVTGKDTEVK